MSFKRILLLPFLLISIFVSAQTARLNGKVMNSQNEVVANASIEISPLNKTIAADVEGRFSIQVESGVKYTLKITSAGYNAKIVDDVTATAGEDNTINIVLENKTLEEVVVRSSVRKETTSALINFQRNNASLSSGLAADFIKRTPDKNTGEILKRVSGTSVQDNKFVVVRGLGDRYNAAFLNGAQLPSSEPDRKAFSFDMIPSIVVDNIVINKTATPDLTGEFAGGLVQVTTKDVPTKDFLTLGVTLGYNTNSTFKDFTSNGRSSTDWLGFDDGRRSLPSGFPSNRQTYASLDSKSDGLAQKIEYTKLFRSDVYKTQTTNAAPIQSYSIAGGIGRKLKNGGSFGTVLSLIYRKSMLTFDVDRNLYQADGLAIQSFNDDQNKNNVNIGAMANFTYVKGKNKISFRNLFNQYLEDNYYTRFGPNIERGSDVRLTSSVANQRGFYTGIFEGNHQLSLNNIKIYWNAGYSLNQKSQPDLRTSAYVNGGIGTNTPFEWDQDDSRRFFSTLKDHNFTAKADITVPFSLFGQKQNFKFGGSTLVRFRDFKSRIFRYLEATSAFDNNLRYESPENIFDRNNISSTGFVMEEFTNNQDKYFAMSTLNAGYAMFDNKLSDKLRLIWGARLEYFEQFLHTKNLSAQRVIINTEDYKILPSVNLTYQINDKNIIRVSGSQTVSRPEFREIAPFQFFDYESTFGIQGTEGLKSTDIYNVDLRYELYPAAGEAISFGGFYKRFVNPIEFRLSSESVLTRRNYSYQNAKDADTYGLELEVRKNLRFLGGESDVFSNFSVFANLTYIFSQVRFDDVSLGKTVSADRPVQGQSPYLINGGLQYSSRNSGWAATALYNRVGNRLSLVGYTVTGFPDIYENARDVIDLQVSKKILNKKAEIKLTVGDLLNQRILLYENVDNARKYTPGTDRVFSSFKYGSNISVGFSYDL